ncbi:peptidase M13 [Sorangium cellulosum]|uniref:Peptidase M13 n=1 Tax=Sorangium cellulosum TaxID=56 RepID=A0A4P2PW65_SORCE|nr:M13 family metallopeptidase [Sorangium cellulosum]AUX20726.1 peptidase M13 [Sorangium cellulosum]
MRTKRQPAATLAIPLALSALLGCGPAASPPPLPPAGAALPSPQPAPQGLPVVETTLEAVGLDGAALDRSVSPCDDFYQFACGGWLAKAEIPGDERAWYRSFHEIEKRNKAELRRILEDAASAGGRDPVSQKIGAFYGACMDEPAIEAAGVAPIADLLARAQKVRDPKGLGALITELHRRRIWALFDISSAQDMKDATRVIAMLDQNGLGLPDRDYYLKEDDKSKALRRTYEEHVARMMRLAGAKGAAATAAAAAVMQIETELAKISKTRVERRDPKGLYNKLDRAALAKAAPSFPWDAYFQGIGRPDIKEVNVTSVRFFEGLSRLLTAVKPAAWQSYLAWHVVRSTAPLLPRAFVDESLTLEAALTGKREVEARWKRCVDATDGALGELLAQPFVKTSFPGASKPAAEAMVREVSEAFRRDVRSLDWMDEGTKRRALAKLDAMAYLIGYPDRWRTYDFEIDPRSYAKSALAARAFHTSWDLGKIDEPLDRDEWQMSPPTVNAYYDLQRNHMVFPAGILQPPFYSVKSSVPVNLGGIGMVVGHELTHGYDDQGSQFDEKGNLEDWWSKEVAAAFKEKTGCVEAQYSAREALPGLTLNGKLTLGENIADLGGVKLAFRAYRAMRRGAAEQTIAGGFTEDQQFFLAHGQAWCGKIRDEALRMMVQVDPHAPPRFRVNGPLANLPEFGEAFQCAPGTPMRPAETCAVW